MRHSSEIAEDISRLDQEADRLKSRIRSENREATKEELDELTHLRDVKAAEEASLYWRSKSEKGSWE